jgi:2-dehydropantoate 2-reductase
VSETAGDEVPCDRTPLLKLAGLLQRHAPFRVRVVPRILPFKYTKLMYNAAINPLAALAGLDNGDLLRIGKARTLFFGLLRENYRILASNKVPLGKIGPFHPTTVHAILQRGVVAKLLAWFFYPTLRGSYCSMSADLPRGRTEIDYFNRHLIDLAGPLPCPLNRRVYDLIKSVESCRTPLGVHLLDQLA